MATLASGTGDAAGPSVTAVARATILPAVHVDAAGQVRGPNGATPLLLRPAHAVKCPVDTGRPCVLLTIDMP